MSSKQAVMYSCTLATKYADLQQKQEHSAQCSHAHLLVHVDKATK